MRRGSNDLGGFVCQARALLLDPAGLRTTYTYGPRRQLAMTTFPDGSQTIRKYDPRLPETERTAALAKRHGVLHHAGSLLASGAPHFRMSL